MDNQGQDGVAHITYYDKALALSFVWDGKHDEVAVSHGGYAEPVVDTFTILTWPFGHPREALRWFESQCQAFVIDWRGRMLAAAQQGFADGQGGADNSTAVRDDFPSIVHYAAYNDAFKWGVSYANGGMVDTRELAALAGFTKVDTAIPQQWADDVERVTGKYPTADGRIFVWSYDDAGIWGKPLPLTTSARELLASYESLSR